MFRCGDQENEEHAAENARLMKQLQQHVKELEELSHQNTHLRRVIHSAEHSPPSYCGGVRAASAMQQHSREDLEGRLGRQSEIVAELVNYRAKAQAHLQAQERAIQRLRDEKAVLVSRIRATVFTPLQRMRESLKALREP